MPKHAILGAAALLLTTAPAAWADLDAPTIWADWQSLYQTMGLELTAETESYEGGTLTLDGLTMTAEIAGAESVANYGSITLVEQGDGTVRVNIPAVIESKTTTEVDGYSQDQTVTFTNEGLSLIVREDGAERVYDFAADAVSMLIETDTNVGPDAPNVAITFTDIVSEYRSGVDGDANKFAQTFNNDALTINVSSEGDAPGVLNYVMSGVEGVVDGTYGDLEGPGFTASKLLNIEYAATITHSGSTTNLSMQNPEGPFTMTGASASGSLGFGMEDGVVSYDIGSTDANVQMQLPMLPVPVSMSMSEARTAFDFPLGPVGEEKPFGMTLSYRGLAIDDALWGLFDPTGQLPRDPADLVVDLEGTAVLNVDVFGDPEAMAGLQGPPGELKGVAIKQILLSLAGAELRGSGDLDFPTPGPVPQPVGTINLALDGGFSLIDKIVALGFIPAEQAAFVKGMAGAVAKPVGDDQLESVIEFTPGGGITANGLPLQ
ncbi:hypothetical protein [Jannaschia pohangensis]|uniref:DUF2125 domain-containing protein n=1 Tax=Jannaschia pohangensis TaxID=390807 RepID=A0A1I3TR22_9RHOB|nr:hypothetical protein [Jannaschia pohangensis]SFJ73255.1 hypothetical protein SAMN04488095_3494 [Jannaschia pohangensis]